MNKLVDPSQPAGKLDAQTVEQHLLAGIGLGDTPQVVLITIKGGGHTWPGRDTIHFLGKSTHDISANDLMWEFFQRHPMK